MAASGWPLRERTCATELKLNGGRGISRRTPLMLMAALPPELRRMSAVTTWPKPWRSTSTGCFDRVFRFRSRALRPRWQAIRLKSQCTRSRCLSRSKGIESGCAACGQGFGAQCTSLLRTGGLPSVGAPRIPGCTQPGPQVGRGQRSMHVVAPGGGGCRAWVRPARRGCAEDPRLRAAWATCGAALSPPRRQSAPAAGGGQRLRHHCFRVG